MSLMLGFEPAKKTNLPYKLENIACDGQTAMRDAVFEGNFYTTSIKESTYRNVMPNLW